MGCRCCAVFDRPKTVALKWKKNGEVTEWNPIFADARSRWARRRGVLAARPRQKGSVENLVGWVKGSFFKQRRFHDRADLLEQLSEWLHEVNTERPSRATGVIPPCGVRKSGRGCGRCAFCRRISPCASRSRSVPRPRFSTTDTAYSMPPEAAGFPGTLYLYRDRVRIVAGPLQAPMTARR